MKCKECGTEIGVNGDTTGVNSELLRLHLCPRCHFVFETLYKSKHAKSGSRVCVIDGDPPYTTWKWEDGHESPMEITFTLKNGDKVTSSRVSASINLEDFGEDWYSRIKDKVESLDWSEIAGWDRPLPDGYTGSVTDEIPKVQVAKVSCEWMKR